MITGLISLFAIITSIVVGAIVAPAKETRKMTSQEEKALELN